MTKKEFDGENPATHYLVVENPADISTWHLRAKGVDGKPDHRLMGEAWAALHGGFRGVEYAGPQKAEATTRLRALYKAEGLIVPDQANEAPFLERRMCVAAEMRVNGKRNPVLDGYAAVFNKLSEDMWGFRERIMPGAFTRALKEKQDVRCLINHDSTLVLGRTKADTLRLTEDEKGLAYSDDLPETSYALDLAECIRRGDVTQSSFAFRVADQRWVTENKQDIREITDVDLFDVSPVTFPAYTQTRVEIRSFIKLLEEREQPPIVVPTPVVALSEETQKRLLRLAALQG